MIDLGGGVGVVFAGFLMDWLAVGLGWKRIRPYTKVAALLLLIGWVLSVMQFALGFPGWLLVLALVFGLAGDILLLFPNKYFKWGLGAFLLGHWTYLSLLALLVSRGITSGVISGIPIWAWAGAILAVILGVAFFYWIIIRGLRSPKPSGLMQAALYLYAICLTAMTAGSYLAAFLFWGQGASLWALPLGGTLFLISDFILAYNRFVQPVRLAHLWIMVSYHLAQFFLAIGFINLISLLPPSMLSFS